MAKDSLFSNSIGGYNKDDVRRYIDDLNIQFTDREAELEGEIKQLKKELEVLPALKQEKERAESLEKELEIMSKEKAGLSEAIVAQGKELEESKALCNTLRAEKDALEIRANELCDREAKLQAEVSRIQADYNMKVNEIKAVNDETDRIRRSLEAEKAEFERRAQSMLLEIQSEAKAIVDKANETAELIVSSARKKAEEISIKTPSGDVQFSYHEKKKDNLSDIFDSHKSKMDSFFSGIVKAFKGDSK